MKILPAFTDELVAILQSGGVAVLRTDTIYGVVARADNEAAVNSVYKLKGRTPSKSPIVLIAEVGHTFDTYDKDEIDQIANMWPGKNSVIFPSLIAPDWVRRGNNSVAYRVPDDDDLRELLRKTGPLIAPSANPEGLEPAMNLQEAIDYFGDKVAIYIDGGQVVDNTPSKLFKVTSEGLERLR